MISNPYSEENLNILMDKLNLKFSDGHALALIKTAISTEAARNEHPDLISENNERLAFLGDSVLKFIFARAYRITF